MNFKKHWEYWAKDLVIAAVFPLVILSIHGLEQLLQAEWFAYGLKPRNLKGLLGIITSPFLHGSWNHVYNNSITMVVLGFFVLQNYRKLYPKLLLYGGIFAGFLGLDIRKRVLSHWSKRIGLCSFRLLVYVRFN